MSHQEILRRSLALAKRTLAVSLAELSHEARNGMLPERVARFAELAVEANDLLSAPIGAPTPKGARKPRKPRTPAIDSQTQHGKLAAILRAEPGEWFPTVYLSNKLGIPRTHVAAVAVKAKACGAKIEGQRGKGYRLV